MTDAVPPPDPAVETAARAEARAIRKRWITLGELVAVAGVVVAALALWNSFYERRDAEYVRAEEQRTARDTAAAERRRIGLIAADQGGESLAFKGVECALQAATITFPAAFGIMPQSTVTVHEIRADWFAKPLRKLIRGSPGHRDGRIPVLIDSQCTAVGGVRNERAIYDIVYRTEARILQSRAVNVRGLVLREAAGPDAKARIDTLWTKR